MTGSHPEPAPHRETGTEDANDHLATQAESRTINFDLPALNSMRPTAPPSRPYGRYAVGLRPSLDPDACFDAPSQDKEACRTNQNNQRLVLTGPAPSGMTCGDWNRLPALFGFNPVSRTSVYALRRLFLVSLDGRARRYQAIG